MLRAILLKISDSKRAAHAVASYPLLRSVARRFVAGETLNEALDVCHALHDAGAASSLAYLGEHVATPNEAYRAREMYLGMFNRIRTAGTSTTVSLKLTQLGLDSSADLAEGLLESIVMCAEQYHNFVRIDMEGSRYTADTVRICKNVHAKCKNVGVALQAYLYRSNMDARGLLDIGCSVRLCKGAYREGPEVALSRKPDVDENYKQLMYLLLTSSVRRGLFHGIATHDRRMIDATTAYAKTHGIAKDAFEFQMLYGIRRNLQEKLVREGYRVRVYVPFGKAWFPYFVRRLAERPANLLFFLKNLFFS